MFTLQIWHRMIDSEKSYGPAVGLRKNYWADFYKLLHINSSDDQMKKMFGFFALCWYIFVPPGINGLMDLVDELL